MTTIDEIEALLARATPGPWRVDQEGHSDWWQVESVDGQRAFSDGSAYGEYSEDCDADTRDLIVALRNAAPDLIAVVRAAAKVAQHPRFVRANDHGLVEALAKLGVGS